MRKTTHELLNENKNYRLSSVLMLLFPDESGIMNTVFIERPVNNSVHSGQLAFPGGKVEESDLNPQYTALRETEEEIGIAADQVKIIGTLSSLFIPASNFLVYPHLGIYNSIPDFIPSRDEVKSLLPVTIQHLLSLQPVTKSFQTSYGNLKAPCFEIQNFNLWGATAMMVSEFREMMKINRDI